MSDLTRLGAAAAAGDRPAAADLLPLVYAELRKLAAVRMAEEKPDQALQPTALVHEASLRLMGGAEKVWDSRGHFFAAGAMRRMLVESDRRNQQGKERAQSPTRATAHPPLVRGTASHAVRPSEGRDAP